MQRSDILFNGSDATSVNSPNFDVREAAVVIAAAGLLPGVEVNIERSVSGLHAKQRGLIVSAWGPVVRNGCPLRLTSDNTQLVVTVPGTYRIVVPAGPHPSLLVSVYDDESSTTFLRNVQFVELPTPCDTSPPCPSAPRGVVSSWGI